MTKEEYLQRLDELALDKSQYYIISGGALLLYGLRERTADIDLRVSPELFEKLKESYDLRPSPKFENLYDLANDIEVLRGEVQISDYDIIDGYPVIKIERELDWKLGHQRPKDQADIRRIRAYLEIKSTNVDEDLRHYIVHDILPEYRLNEEGHQIDHINYVIQRSLKFAETVPDINRDMVFAVAAFHDIGHHIDAKHHEQISSERLAADAQLINYFSESEIMVMADAVLDHRSSSESEPRSIYGKIVASADLNTSIEEPLRRTYSYRKAHSPKASLDEIIDESYAHLAEKFGNDGYARERMYFEDVDYDRFLFDIAELMRDKERFRKEFLRANQLEG